MFRFIKSKEQIRRERQDRLANTVRQNEDADNVAEMVVLNAMDKEELAEMVVLNAMDKDELANMVGYCLMRIDELEAEING